jgi:hypothetical protein
MFFLEQLKFQLATKFKTLNAQWQQSVYKKIQLESELPQLECANQCLNFEGGKCNWFVQFNLICFFGNSATLNGSINSNLTSNVVHVSTGNILYPYFTVKLDLTATSE